MLLQLVLAAASTITCDGYRATVRPSVDGGILKPDTVRIASAGAKTKKVIDVADGATVVLRCLDVTGDERPELIITNDGSGQHCCAELRIVQLHPRIRVLLDIASEGSGEN